MKNYICLFLLCFSLLSFGQETAKPLSGEGITAFLRRHHREGNEYFQQFVELNQAKLGRDNTLLLGVSYVIPPLNTNEEVVKEEAPVQEKTPVQTQKKGYLSLFGDQYAEYPIESDRLKGACFFLESGHGGPDPGAITKIGNIELHEDEYAYDIMLRLARNLLMNGATVHIIIQDPKDGIRNDVYLSNSDRETCMGTTIHQGTTTKDNIQRLNQKSDKINSLSRNATEKYKRSIFIHLDSRKQTKEQVDIFFYYFQGSEKGKKLADGLLSTIRAKYKQHQPNRSFKGTSTARNLHALRETTPPGVLVELGNIWNNRDRERFLKQDNRQAVANWLRDGLIKDYEDSKKN